MPFRAGMDGRGFSEGIMTAFHRPLSLAAVAAALLAACGTTAVDPTLTEPRGSSPLARTFAEASLESGVPVDLLLAVGYSESRFSQRAGRPSALDGYGVMHLRHGSTLQRAAELSGSSVEELKRDARANVRGAALVLAELAREAGALPASLPQWKPALARYSGLGEWGPEYAAQVLGVLADGAQGADEQGQTLAVLPHPEARVTLLPGELAQMGFEARPDYASAEWVGPSPNSSSRSGTAIDMVVIHTCQGAFSGCSSWLMNPSAQASAHYVVASDGHIHQLVEEYLKAWHATCVNPRSVGIEHEGYVDDPDRWYTDAMYCASAKLVKSICTRHGFSCDRSHVIGHKEANDLYCGPGHTDPGPGWNWTKFMSYVNSGCGGAGTGRLLGFVYKNPTNDAASRLAGATVKLDNGASTTTDSTGLYTFTVAPGSYTATASASGYASASATRAVAAGADTWGSIGLDVSGSAATGQYYGAVYEVNAANPTDMSKKLPGASVTLDTGATATARATDAIFKFDNVKTGTRTATATLAGYKTGSSTKDVAACSDPATCATWASIGLVKDGGTVVSPPRVAITTPADGATLDEAQLDLTGQVDNATDVKTVKVEWAGQSVDAPIGAGAAFSAPIKVPPGDTTITVTATNGAGSGSASVTVHFKTGLCGFVYESAGEGGGGESARIGGASVELLPSTDLCAAAVASATTQSPDGTWCIDAAPGAYFLRVKAAGHLTSVEGVTVSDERRDTSKVGVPAGTDPAPGIEITDPVPVDGKISASGSTVTLQGTVQGMNATKVTANGTEVTVSENTFTLQDFAVSGETTVDFVATGACGETANLSVTLVPGSTSPDAGSKPDGGSRPVSNAGACGCASGGEGLTLAGIAAMLAALVRRRR